MDFKKTSKFGAYISKDYAEDIFRLLINYQDISASEAASRLNLHIKTVQDFLEAMADLEILGKTEVYEKKRPYFRYFLKKHQINIEIDLSPLHEKKQHDGKLSKLIKERKSSGAKFQTARYHQYFSNITIWIGKERDLQERKINLTIPQGKFLYHLPFPSAEYQSISEIMKKADVEESHASEIIDIVDLLVSFNVIEVMD
jgi:predicted ArsR family transcriptional regulator